MASAVTTRSRSAAAGRRAATVAGSAAASTGSISIATTRAPVSSRARVSEPRPGPTSTTTSPASTPAVRTILRTVPGSTTKFWPRVLVGRMPSVPASARTSAGPSRGSVAGPAGEVTPPTLSAPPSPPHRRAPPYAPRAELSRQVRDNSALGGGGRRGGSGQRRPSWAEQAGHWPQPARAWSIWARLVCSAGEAWEGRPLPPTACQVCTENWYRPWYRPLGLTIEGLPPDSHWASAAHTPLVGAEPPPELSDPPELPEELPELLEPDELPPEEGAGAAGRGAGRGLVPTATISETGAATVTER